MATLAARWEWRGFGSRFGSAERMFAQLPPQGTQESDEIYPPAPGASNVKVRDALMDIKALRQVDADGLEQWVPVMKPAFPLSAADAARVIEALGLAVPALARRRYGLDEFLADFAAPGGAIRSLPVHKPGSMPIRARFSREQLAFYDAHAPAGVDMNSLLTLGPTFLLKAKHMPKAFPRGLTVEMWLYPDGSRILELSTKCLPAEAFQAGAEFRAYLSDSGIDITAAQQTKTRSALEFFRAALKPARRAGKAGKAPASVA